MSFPDLVFAFTLGVFSALFMRQVVVAAWRFSIPKEKPADIVDEENVVRIQKWKERRSETDKTFGRRA